MEAIIGIVCFVAGIVCCRLYYNTALTEFNNLKARAKADIEAARRKI